MDEFETIIIHLTQKYEHIYLWPKDIYPWVLLGIEKISYYLIIL